MPKPLAAADEPPYLTVGTDVSAKYKGAFCEAKIIDVNKHVKLRVLFDGQPGSYMIDDTGLKQGSPLEVGSKIEARHPTKKQQVYINATIQKIFDQSRYTVVFDDGDQCILRRNSICLKSGKHFAESETLDQLPLTNPEHFGNPVKVGQDSTEQDPSSKSDVDFAKIEIGVKLMVQYGKGKVQNVYEAKVNKIDTNTLGKTRYLVHYTGWNNRYDEWITNNRILSIVTSKDNLAKESRSKQVEPNSIAANSTQISSSDVNVKSEHSISNDKEKDKDKDKDVKQSSKVARRSRHSEAALTTSAESNHISAPSSNSTSKESVTKQEVSATTSRDKDKDRERHKDKEEDIPPKTRRTRLPVNNATSVSSTDSSASTSEPPPPPQPKAPIKREEEPKAPPKREEEPKAPPKREEEPKAPIKRVEETKAPPKRGEDPKVPVKRGEDPKEPVKRVEDSKDRDKARDKDVEPPTKIRRSRQETSVNVSNKQSSAPISNNNATVASINTSTASSTSINTSTASTTSINTSTASSTSSTASSSSSTSYSLASKNLALSDLALLSEKERKKLEELPIIDEPDCDKRISILQEKIMSIRQTYMALKAELADLSRSSFNKTDSDRY